MSAFIATAASRETSKEIMEAIFIVAGKNEARAVEIWEDPSTEQMLAIWERVTKNGLIPADDFCWGEAGREWAASV